jgi:saccharopine dehydrogenase-like NADP-dependent oxidoreductase
MQEHTKTILVTGAYGHAGNKIVKGLIEKTMFQVLATGRKAGKLESLKKMYPSDRIITEVLDLDNKNDLKLCAQKADMVINAVGPYSMGGIEIAKTILACKIPYIDLANEQLHLNNLRKIRNEIEESGSMVFTCAGQSPGISTLVMIHLANLVTNVDNIEMYGVVGRLPTPDQTLGSIMSGIIEASLDSTTYVNGKQVHEKLGKFIKEHTMPEPFGTMKMLSCPLNDSILVPEVIKCKGVRTLFGLQMDISPNVFKMMAILKPHKRKWVYRLLEKMTKKTLKDNYLMGLKEGFDPGGYMKVVVTGSKEISTLIKVEDNSVMTSYMPVVIAINYFENPERFKGLLTPSDIYSFDSFNKELEKLGWKITLDIKDCN